MAVALGTVSAGCGTAVSPSGQALAGLTAPDSGPPDSGPPESSAPGPAPEPGDQSSAAGTSQEDDVSGPSLLPAVKPAVEIPAEQQPPATTSTAPFRTSTTIPVAVEGAGPAPQDGHPPAPQPGMVPREHPYWNHPDCASGPPWPSGCYPPTEWETPQDLSDCFAPYPDLGVGGICASGRVDETPRWTSDVIRWTSWCFNQPSGNCTWLLYEMKWALDYLGAHPWCVLNAYQDRVNAYTGGGTGKHVQDRHGWHNCATVIDPLATDPPAGRSGDGGLLLSDTVSLAEQCRRVLPADVELETRTLLFSAEPDQRFGSDCDAWAGWVQDRPKGVDRRACDRSARLAEEWMEHYHDTPERYYIVYC